MKLQGYLFLLSTETNKSYLPLQPSDSMDKIFQFSKLMFTEKPSISTNKNYSPSLHI